MLGPLVPACHWARVELGPMNMVLLLAGGQDGSAKPYSPKQKSRR